MNRRIAHGPSLTDGNLPVLIGVTQPDGTRPLSAWLKDPRSIATDGATVNARSGHQRLGVEAEVALVIGRSTRDVAPKQLANCVRGWTIANDITDLDHADDPRTFQAKNGRGYTPLGPRVIPGLPDPTDQVSLLVDGLTICSTAVSVLAVPPLGTLRFVCQWIDLEPGDIVMTGAITPSISVQRGATVAITIGDCGPLHCTIRGPVN